MTLHGEHTDPVTIRTREDQLRELARAFLKEREQNLRSEVMNPLQLTWTPPRDCVRCNQPTREARLCQKCAALDEQVTKYQLRGLKLIFSAFPHTKPK